MEHRTRFSLAIAAACLLAACGQEQAQDTPATDSAPVASSEGSAPPASLRLYVFDCGTMQADVTRFRLERSEVATNVLATPCFMVAHPNGTLMWDVGAVPDADWMPTGGPVAHHLVLPDNSERNLTLTKPLLAQLAEAGYQPADITYLGLSHYHWDHVANANAFANATSSSGGGAPSASRTRTVAGRPTTTTGTTLLALTTWALSRSGDPRISPSTRNWSRVSMASSSCS